MRKLYAFLAGFIFLLAGTSLKSQPGVESCIADFEKLNATANPLQVTFRAIPGHSDNLRPVQICWQFGDGTDTCIQYSNTHIFPYTVTHTYAAPGEYQVCVRITYAGGCVAEKCKGVFVGHQGTCTADFTRINPNPTVNPLLATFKALPWHSQNRKPKKICWEFGDGRDTCINYSENYTGQYIVSHRYQHQGLYEVCVKIYYYGGCEARKCREVRIGHPVECTADFEKLATAANPLNVFFRALPWHNQNRKPQRICWRFGDGRDTCIYYPENYTGPYTVTHTYNHPGNYEVCVTIRYYGGCEARKCREITVPPIQHCSVTLQEIIPTVHSLTRGFFASISSNPYRRPERICWEFGDGEDTCIMIPPTVTNILPYLFITHTYPGPGVYRACVKVKFQGGCEARDCEEVFIRSHRSVCGGFMTDSILGPRSFRFKAFGIHNPNDEVLSYYWTFGDGTSAIGREVSHTYAQPGLYEVCVRMRTRLGCETRICKPLRVGAVHNSVLHLSPNPVINVMNVSFQSTHTEAITMRILNGSGVVVRNYTRNVTAGPNNWSHDLSLLTPGAYSYVVQSPNQLASAIFLKQ